MQTLIDRTESAASFEHAAAKFESARRNSPPQERWYVLADRVMRLRVAGVALAEELFAPFEHLRTAAGESFLTIDVWNEAETGIDRSARACRRRSVPMA